MERYIVSIQHPEGESDLQLLIPFLSTSPVSLFVDEVKRRIAKRGFSTNGQEIFLRLEGNDGPILDIDDKLDEVIINPRTERVFVTFWDAIPETMSSSMKKITPDANSQRNSRGFKIRVITPFLAKSIKDICSIPLLANGKIINGHMTLREIKSLIIEFLGLSVNISTCPQSDYECNCMFARRIHEHGVWEKIECQSSHYKFEMCSYRLGLEDISRSLCAMCTKPLLDHKEKDCENIFVRRDTGCNHVLHGQCLEQGESWRCPPSCLSLAADLTSQVTTHKIIVVHGNSDVESMELNGTDRASIMAAIRERFGSEVEGKKTINIVGGISRPSSVDEYLKLPVLSLCSRERHATDTGSDGTIKKVNSSSGNAVGREKVLDLHTLEIPIETTNLNLTIDEIGLEECIVNGVLNIYAVERTVWSNTSARGSGQDAIFMDADFWEHPTKQSDRGMAAFLSSLRLFTDRISAKKMNQSAQNAILRLVLIFTRFPPALRAIHTLMSAKSLRATECAALVQALYQVVKNIVPLELVQSDEGRILEGSRLLFGFLLDRVAQVEDTGQDYFPYIWSLKTIDLKNFETMEPVRAPILTSAGLVEEGYYEAYKEGGILSWCNGEDPLKAVSLDNQTRRITLLCGGIVPEITIFDSDSLSSHTQDKDLEEEELIGEQAFSSLNLLATLCGHNDFAVVSPADLQSSNAPVLTLDQDGNLAVYVGRTPSSPPGKDIAIFCPTKGGEKNIDVSIVTQMIAPILQQRSEDGTWVFDLFGGVQKARTGNPDELIIFCVDCSKSMDNSSDFEEIKDVENSDEIKKEETESTTLGGFNIESDVYVGPTLEDMKDMVLNHESFEDILAIVRNATVLERMSTATLVLEYMGMLLSRELSAHLKKLEYSRRWTSVGHFQNRIHDFRAQLAKLKGRIAGLATYRDSLRDFILFRIESSGYRNEDWIWTIGKEIPQRPKRSLRNFLLETSFVIPQDYICPIGREVFEDPVTTSEGFTYERSSIQRWFQFRKTSPSTGLEIGDTTVKRNFVLAERVKEWVNGNEFQESPTRRSKKLSSSLAELKIWIMFSGQFGSFQRQVPKTISTSQLYKLAFQGMRGRYASFDLQLNGKTIDPSKPSDLPLSRIKDNSTIDINIHETITAPFISGRAATQADFEETSLVKVYTGFGNDDALFSYWTSKNTASSVASIAFRYWRYLMEKGLRSRVHDVTIWTNMEYVGDGSYRGSTNDHWTRLSSLLTPMHAVGSLEKEKVYTDKANFRETADKMEIDPVPKSCHPLVLKVYLEAYRTTSSVPVARSKNLSRMDVSKQIFDAFINRTLAYNYSTHVGLITFDSTAKVSQPLTNVLEDFRASVDKMKPKGDTALWDALVLANSQLCEYGEKFPGVKKRIICLSDGEDNKSLKQSYDACWDIVSSQVIVDSFCLGNVDNTNLRTISYLSGGYKFFPKTVEQAMSICEMEPVLSQLERPPIIRESVPRFGQAARFLSSRHKATPDIVTRDSFPERRPHPNLDDQFISISALSHSSRPSAVVSSPYAGVRSNSHVRSGRLISELRNILANPHPHYDVYVSESNMGFWKVVMQGPPESSYQEGTFLLYLDMEENYPMFPPKGRLCTPIIHPNINRHGRICHSILDRNWTLDTTNLQVLNTIYSLLLVPEHSDPINTVVTLNFHWDEVAFQEDVKAHIRKHATKSRGAWRREFLGE